MDGNRQTGVVDAGALMTRFSSMAEQQARLMQTLSGLATTHAQTIQKEHLSTAKGTSEKLKGVLTRMSNPQAVLQAYRDYMVDASQRSILFADVLRRRGNAFLERQAAGNPPVLNFKFKPVLDGKSLPRPVNYNLVHILPAEGVRVDDSKRPFLVIDPRAGHGAGIGGFKPESQVGVALSNGHPCYFAVFHTFPEPGQTLADICDAEAEFLREIARRHPGAPKAVLVGNCQGGWATMLLAARHPELCGPLTINGAPLSYWAGETGKNPMRYSGGLKGGAMPALLASDLGHGVFDGAHLVSNFEKMNPANTMWKKYYNVFANVDSEAERFLEFEEWWSGFFMMNENEIRWIVNNLFIGNKLTRGEAMLGGEPVDLRRITSPIIVFASVGDNITPPPQALNWIADLYSDVSEIKARGQRIVYMVHQTIGHLGIFVSGKIAEKEHEAIADAIDAVEGLSPGLYEMFIDDTSRKGEPVFHLEPRTIDDILKYDDGREDEEMFATVARLSELGEQLYEVMARPLIKAMVTPESAQKTFDRQSLRSQRAMMSDRNALLQGLPAMAAKVRQERQAVAKDNPFFVMENLLADMVEQNMNFYRDTRDAIQELMFHSIYATPMMRALGAANGTGQVARGKTDVRLLPEARAALTQLDRGGYAEAVVRMLVMVNAARGSVRRARLENAARVLEETKPFSDMGEKDRTALMSQQSLIVDLEPQRALSALAVMLPGASERQAALDTVMAMCGPLETMSPGALAKYKELEALLAAPAQRLSGAKRGSAAKIAAE
jgi:pimeloyl-ACP methyl ester carboxylesterase